MWWMFFVFSYSYIVSVPALTTNKVNKIPFRSVKSVAFLDTIAKALSTHMEIGELLHSNELSTVSHMRKESRADSDWTIWCWLLQALNVDALVSFDEHAQHLNRNTSLTNSRHKHRDHGIPACTTRPAARHRDCTLENEGIWLNSSIPSTACGILPLV